MASGESCGGCRFWVRVSESARGHCRRQAPRHGQFGRAQWPETTAADWCGAFSKAQPSTNEGANADGDGARSAR